MDTEELILLPNFKSHYKNAAKVNIGLNCLLKVIIMMTENF